MINDNLKVQNAKMKRMLLELEREIKKIEFDIKHSKISNFKIKTLRKLKISLYAVRTISPYLITGGIVFGSFAAFGQAPFIKDNVKKELEIKKELDSFGNIRYEEQYDEFLNDESTISYVSRWYAQNDGLYFRKIKTYSINGVGENIVNKIVNDLEINSLEDLFGPPIFEKIEKQNNLSKDEIKKEAYLESITYSKKKDDFIVVKESLENNVLATVLWFLITLFVEIFPYVIRNNNSNGDFEDFVKKVKKEYPLINITELSKNLEIKKHNYERLTR